MITGRYASVNNPVQIKRLNMGHSAMINGRPKGQIEVAVIDGSIPIDTDLVAAHKPWKGKYIKRFLEDIHVTIQFSFYFKVLSEAANRHIGQGDQMRERESETVFQLFPVDIFQIIL